MFSSLISKFIVVLLALGLVISLGVGSDFVSFGMSKNVVAEINNNEISKEEFQYFRNTRLSQLLLLKQRQRPAGKSLICHLIFPQSIFPQIYPHSDQKHFLLWSYKIRAL